MIGLLLAGTVYWACTVLVLHFNAFGEDKAAAASLPGIVVKLFGVKALWVACVIGYLACFASLNIYIQSFARLVWSQARYKPESRLARLSKRQLPMNALNAVLGCCVLSSLGIYLLDINLDALIIYANGIFIMIYLLCMLSGCRLLKGRYKALAVVGGVLCLLLLAMVGWKSAYAIVMLAGLWAFYRSGKIRRPGKRSHRAKIIDRLYGLNGRAVHPCADTPFEGIACPVLNPPPGMRLKRRCGSSFMVRCFCTGGNSNSRPRKSVKNPGRISSRPAIISDTLLIISSAGLSPAAIFCCIIRKF